jgi:hypothetical protein
MKKKRSKLSPSQYRKRLKKLRLKRKKMKAQRESTPMIQAPSNLMPVVAATK